MGLSLMASENDIEVNIVGVGNAIPCRNSYQIYEGLTIKDFIRDSKIVKGVFLFTDEDVEMVDYIEKNFKALNKLSGDWSEIYLLEQETTNDIGIPRWLNNIILGSSLKPFNRNESYDIARKFKVPFDAFPCLVIVPCTENLFSYKKLIMPIHEVSKGYFRKLFTILEEIINSSQNINKYEELENNFDLILSYISQKSSRISSQTITEYQVNGQNILFVDEIRSLKMSENNPINISESNIASVTGSGKIKTAIINKYPPEQGKTLAEAADEIQKLLNQLSVTYTPTTQNNNLQIIASKAVESIEKNPSLRTKIVNALKVGGTEALKELVDHPAINILIGLIEGWNSAE